MIILVLSLICIFINSQSKYTDPYENDWKLGKYLDPGLCKCENLNISEFSEANSDCKIN